jgi:hypothetical protein
MLDEKNFSQEKPNFADCIYIIDEELLKRKSKWRLNAIAWMDFDDVCQKIRLHIFNKWSQWDNQRPIRPWLNTVITNQITNLVRNNYSSFSKPCSKCEYNQGGDLCALYGVQSGECSDYAKWEGGKKNAYDIKLPISIHDNFNDQNGQFNNTAMDITDKYSYVDYENKIKNFHEKIHEKLTIVEWKVYTCLYIENKNEIDTAKQMGYRTSEKNRSPGYKQIKKIKNKIYRIAKQIISEI